MLELRVTGDAKRIASMRDAIMRECGASKLGPEHAATVALVAERLVGGDRGDDGRRRRSGRRAESLVILTVQSDATMLMVRETNAEATELGDERRRLLEDYTSRWSTMCGSDGRTIWAEIARTAAPARIGALPCAP
jgi:hypothetical protein